MDNRTSSNITQTHKSASQPGQGVRFPNSLVPFVRYAETDSDGNPSQFPRLHSLRERVPANADFVSPVYLLSDKQVVRHDDRVAEDELFRTPANGSIAKKIQNECEDDGRVWYPLFVESDADVQYHEMRAGLKRFIREVPEVEPTDAAWFFSGNRSLHVHLSYYVANEDALVRLRRETQQYNEDVEVTVDASNFCKKNPIRLPGAEHHSTGTTKTAISPTSPDQVLQKRIAQLVAGVVPEKRPEIDHYSRDSEIVWHSLSEELEVITDIPTPLVEQQTRPDGGANLELWKRYNRHPFCPCANAGNQRRSVVVAQVKGTPFCRKTTVNGREEWRTYIPTYIYGAVGCDGEYTVWQENAPVHLSPQDYNKWEYEPGATLVLLGGNSGSSRIIEIKDTFDRKAVAAQLLPDINWTSDSTDGRREALNLLCAFGYEVGSAGKNGPRRETSANDRGFQSTDAYRLQQRAEEDDVESLSHDERLDIANRLLQVRGWSGADEWFREQYGERYSQEITHKFLRSVAEEYDDLPSPP